MGKLRRAVDLRQRRIRRRADKSRGAGLSSGPSGDEVYTPSPRRSEGQCGQLGGTLFAPHCEQNLYANPKRTAKSFSPLLVISYTNSGICSKIFLGRFMGPAQTLATKEVTQQNRFSYLLFPRLLLSPSLSLRVRKA